MPKITFTIDVEPDLHTGQYVGITKGLEKAEEIFDKYKIKPILFVTCDCIEKHPRIFQRLKKKGWEISLHGYRHKRFDSMSKEESEHAIKKAVSCFQKLLKIKPKGFRAPQHSIDSKTLDLLEKYNFEYDSSYAPLNFLQLIFFPKKLSLWAEQAFSPRNRYKIRKNLTEIPCSSICIPLTSLTFRILPVFILRAYIFFIKKLYKEPIFYCHSWDFIKVKGSRIEKYFNHDKFIKKLSKILENEKRIP